MKKSGRNLQDVLNAGNSSIRDMWKSTEAAGDDNPIPRGEYVCHAVHGELINARTTDTPGFKVTFEVAEGEYKGRRVWFDAWLTQAALPRTKRDLLKMGVTDLEQLEQPLPEGFRCKVLIVLRKDDDGVERNEVRRFEVIEFVKPEPNPFAPRAGTDSDENPDAIAGVPV